MNRKEFERLLQGLQQFANLGDSVEDFQRFSQAWPDFFPASFRSWKEPTLTLDWFDGSHGLVLAVRNFLRVVWRTGSVRDLSLLLGVGRHAERVLVERERPNPMDEMLSRSTEDEMLGASTEALYEAMKRAPDGYFADLPTVYPDWQRGEFHYEPRNNFQKAVHLLWRQSWRAKVCRRCRSYFVADKPAQLYCSVACFSEEKKERGRVWWREHGDEWRADDQKGKRSRKTGSKSSRRTKR